MMTKTEICVKNKLEFLIFANAISMCVFKQLNCDFYHAISCGPTSWLLLQ